LFEADAKDSAAPTFPLELQTVKNQRPFDTPKIKIVGAKNLQISQLIPHAELVVSP
jgi:hypothetical protein